MSNTTDWCICPDWKELHCTLSNLSGMKFCPFCGRRLKERSK
jgi:hypothetical protein